MPKLSVKLWGTLAQILCSSHLFQVAEAQQSAVARAKSISASLKFSSSFHASSPVARSFDNISGRTQAQAGQSATASVYLRLEDGLFFDQENRQINSSVQELLAVFKELDDFLGHGHVWLKGHSRDEAVLETGTGEGWVRAGGAQEPSDGALMRSGNAAFLLASLASSGFADPLVPRDDAFAVHALRQAMAALDLGAELALADRYFEGRGVEQNCSEGMRLARGAAELLLSEAEAAGTAALPVMEAPLLRQRLRDGSYPWSFRDMTPAAVHYHEAAGGAKGILGALEWIGLRGADREGHGIERLQDVQAQAMRGDTFAILDLGNRLVNGDMVPQNYEQALVLYQAAADLGDPGGLMGLGYMHLNGLGTSVNMTAAIEAYEGAASMEYPDACFYLGGLYGGLFEGVPPETINFTLSEEKYQCAYFGGHYKAPYMLALIHEEGIGVEPNCTKAARYIRVVLAERSNWTVNINTAIRAYDKGDAWKALMMLVAAAEQGSAIAMHNAAFLLQRGHGYNGSDAPALALELLLRSAAIEHQYGDGLVDAANLLLQGDRFRIPGGTNRTAAKELYKEAAARGDVEAMTNLAWMHAAGLAAPDGGANVSAALELYWNAVERAPDASHAAAPFLAFWWLRALAALGWWRGAEGTARQDVTNICVLLGALWLVLWLRQTRSAARRQ